MLYNLSSMPRGTGDHSIYIYMVRLRDSAAESGESGCAISSDGKYANPYC